VNDTLTCSKLNFRVFREETLRCEYASIGSALELYDCRENDQLYTERLVVVVVVRCEYASIGSALELYDCREDYQLYTERLVVVVVVKKEMRSRSLTR